MREALDNSPALGFLTQLWEGKPPACAVQIWEKRTKKTYSFAELDAAATQATYAADGGDIYLAAGIAAQSSSPRKARANANEVVGIPGLWADIDVNGGPDAKTEAAPDRDAAIALAHTLIEPTLLVNSGYGIQAWWLFDDGPWIFGTHDERDQAARLSQGFQQALRNAARQAGFTIDSTFDLARLMRLPGTLNHKNGSQPVPVELLDHEGARHTVEALSGVAREHMASIETVLQTLAGNNIEVTVNGQPPQPPFERIMELIDLDAEFDVVWNHRPSTKTKQWSMSEYDMSIANSLDRVGCTDQEIADALRYHRRRFGDEGGKGDRVDYLKRTIGKARGREAHEASKREAEFEREDTIDRLTEVASAPAEGNEAATISLFARVVGGPEIKELVQEGRDPDNSRFKLVLSDGREVPLGTMDGLMSQDKFRRAFATVTSHLPKRVTAKKWDDVVQALLNAATINEGVEDTRAARAVSWVERYCEQRISTDVDAACAALDPFEKNGMIHVPLGPLRQWLAKVLGERIAEIDLKLMLEAAGFERHTIAYARRDGKRTSRSYFRAPLEVLAENEARDAEGAVA